MHEDYEMFGERLYSSQWYMKKAKWTLIEKINFSCLNYAILTTKITTYCVIN